MLVFDIVLIQSFTCFWGRLGGAYFRKGAYYRASTVIIKILFFLVLSPRFHSVRKFQVYRVIDGGHFKPFFPRENKVNTQWQPKTSSYWVKLQTLKTPPEKISLECRYFSQLKVSSVSEFPDVVFLQRNSLS